MKAALDVDSSALPNARQFRDICQAGLNRTIARARTFAGRKTTETYNLSTRDIAPFIRTRNVTRSGPLEGSLDLRVRAIPIETFKPRVVMQRFTYAIRGQMVTRRLPTIELKRFRKGNPKKIPGAFPLQQRVTGRLRTGDKVRRRIGSDRNRLTNIRYYTFPKRFVNETLLPEVRAFVGPRLRIEIDAAFRKFNLATGQRTLRGNRVPRGGS
ncbi:MAG: hypothetical protein NTZ11_18395 [Gammaproteobacteria bacterium]|nr:hypothetical protein [Gammaproteobacteria bacterium]